MKFLLFVIALVPTTILTLLWLPINIIYHIFTFKWKTGSKKIGRYFYQMALSIDQFANVSLQTPLNFLLVNRQSEYVSHGSEDDTISYVIARNQQLNSLTWFGKFWAWFLDKVDKDHLKKTLINKRKQELDARGRVHSRLNLN
jgi:hypothetical protein